MYSDRKGRPIDLMDWAQRLEDREYSVVAQHWIRGWMVSTVWLGLDHNFAFGGPPVIFETMVFPPGDGGPYNVTAQAVTPGYGYNNPQGAWTDANGPPVR